MQVHIQFLSADQMTSLEGRWLAPAADGRPLAVLAHHYPPMSNMDHRALFATFKVLRARGWGVLRYNSRGVGGSQGEFTDGPGEDLDLDGAVAEARRLAPSAAVALVGWSFGAMRVLRRMAVDPTIAATVAVTPNPAGLNLYGRGVHTPFLAIIAEQDQYFDLIETRTAFELASEPKTWHFLKGADHFYVTREHEVAEFTVDWLEQTLAANQLL